MAVYDNKETVWVNPINGVKIAYVFGTNIESAAGAVLGHKLISVLDKPGVAGASAPKPARLSLKRASGTISSFVDWENYAAAIAANWKVAKGAKLPPQPGSTAKTTVMRAEVATDIYAVWNMREEQRTAIGATDLSGLGVIPLTTAEAKTAVRGGNRWYGVGIIGASNKLADKTLSLKYVDKDAAATLPAGWTLTSNTGLSDPTLAI